jgi:RHS repeat-associated protein
LLCLLKIANKCKTTIGTTIVSTFENITISEQTGLTYAGARYYPARVGKWLSVDPHYFNYPTLTPYHYVANNPVNAIDPDGRDIYLTQEGYDIVQNDGLKPILGENNPFGYDKETGKLTFDDSFDLSNYDEKQMEVVNRLQALTESEDHHVYVNIVGRNEEIRVEGRTTTLAEFNHGNSPGGSNGATETFLSRENYSIVGSRSDVCIAGDAIDRHKYKSPKARGITSLHEIGGHAYENAFNSHLSDNERNTNTTNFE